MADIKKQAIFYGDVEGVLVELMAKTNVENVVYSVGEDGTEVYLSTKLAEMLATMATLDTTANREAAILALKQEMLGDTPVEAYNTFTELAQYISTHQEAADALTAAIGNKVDTSVFNDFKATLGSLATLNEVGEDNLSAALKEKVNSAAEGNHSHSNKNELDKIAEGDKAKWDEAAGKAHEHSNKEVIDGLTAEQVAQWKEAVTKLATLIGEDAAKTVRTIANEELAKQLIPENAQESLDTLTELAAWFQSHPNEAAAMNAAIVALQNKVDTGDQTVSAYVAAAITALQNGDIASANSQITALSQRVTALETMGHVEVVTALPAEHKAGTLYIKISQ